MTYFEIEIRRNSPTFVGYCFRIRQVHNWTVEQTAEWLSTNVELPQYVPVFIIKRVTGAHLPRLNFLLLFFSLLQLLLFFSQTKNDFTLMLIRRTFRAG